EEPGTQVVYRRAQRIRDDRPAPGMAARGGPLAVRRAAHWASPSARSDEPRLHPRGRRAGRHDRVLRGEPVPDLSRRHLRDAEDRGDAAPLWTGQAHRGGRPRGPGYLDYRARRTAPRLARAATEALRHTIRTRRTCAGTGRRQEAGR